VSKLSNKLDLPELAIDPSAPVATERTIYAKAGGIYTRDSAGNVVGPLAAAGGGGASYLVYTAVLTQVGVNAPVAVLLENTLTVSASWSRDGAGAYVLNIGTGENLLERTVVFYGCGDINNTNTPTPPIAFVSGNNTEGVLVFILAASDGDVIGFPIEIRVYPSII